MRLRYGENFAGSTQAVRYGETRRSRRRQGDVSSRRPCARLGADRGRGRRPAHRRLRRLQERRRSDLRAVRAGAVRRLHHRGDLRVAGVPPRRPATARSPSSCAFGGAVSRARASRRRLFARQGAARDRAASARPATTRRSICMARWRSITRYYASRGIALGELRAGARRQQGRACRHHHALPALGLERSLDAPFPRAGRRLRVRLDAGARPRAPARRRAAAGHFRSRRLGRPYRHDRGDRRRRNLGHPRPGGRAGALVHDARAEGAAARYRRLWRGGRYRTARRSEA